MSLFRVLELKINCRLDLGGLNLALISNILSGFVILDFSYYYISFFVSFINISVGFYNLFPWIGSIYYRF